MSDDDANVPREKLESEKETVVNPFEGAVEKVAGPIPANIVGEN